VQSSAVKNKRATGREDNTQDSNDVVDNTVVEMYEQVGTEELGNDDYGDSVDYEGDDVTLEPISFEDIS